MPAARGYSGHPTTKHRVCAPGRCKSAATEAVGLTNREPDTPQPTTSSSQPELDRIGPYRLLRPLGRGGMASVYLVEHVDDGERYALKLLHASVDDPNAESRFRREFRALSRLLHPNVLKVHERGSHEGRQWFTMEYVDGRDLRQAIADWATLSPDDRMTRIQSVLVQTTRALAYVHERGFIHRDITPANLMIRHDGAVKLMDFGLVTDHTAERTQVRELVGTAAYTAPEQVRGERVDARADLYALGAVLYQALTLRKPFTAHTVQGYMEKHLNEVPRRPSELDPLIPDLLDRVAMRLLEKRPEDRFASASHLLRVLGDVSDPDLADRWPPRTVGRTDIKAWIRKHLEDVAAGRSGGVLRLTGPSGHGKTRMLDLAEKAARRLGLRIARGRSRPHDRPFGAYGAIYRSLKPVDPPSVLEDTFVRGEPPRERYPVNAAFREIITESSPCLIILDSLQHADGATRELTEYLIRNTLSLTETPVVFLLAAETRNAQAQPPSWATEQVVDHMHLSPLTASEVEETVLSVLPETPSTLALAARLYEESRGAPSHVADMLRSLVDEGVLERDGDQWQLTLSPEEISRSQLPLPPSLRQALEERLSGLGEDAMELGRTVALALRSVDLDALMEASPFDEDRTMEALDALVDAGAVTEHRQDDADRIELAHSRFRDILVDPLEPQLLRDRHRRLGEIIERRTRHLPAGAVESLAYHFEQADVPPKAYAYLVRTARKHLQRGLHEEALHFLDRAVLMEPYARPFLILEDADRSLAEVRLARARSLYALGRWHLALADARLARELAEQIADDAQLAEVEAEIGGLLWNQGQIELAERCLEIAVRYARRAARPALLISPLYLLGAIAWSRGRLTDAQQRWEECLQMAREISDRFGEGRAYNGLAIVAFCQGESREARRLFEQSAETFEAVGEMQQLAITRFNLVELYLWTGALRKAIQLNERGLALAREVHHVHGVALGLLWRARLLNVLGRPQEARPNAVEALRIVRELGTVDDEAQCLEVLVQTLLSLGRADEAIPLIDHLQSSLRTADHEGMSDHALALLARVRISSGHPELAEDAFELLSGENAYPHVSIRRDLDLADAFKRLGRQQEAAERAEAALSTAIDGRYRYHELHARHMLHQVHADPEVRAQHGRRARSMARSFAASLDRADATSFLQRSWGELGDGPAPEA